MSHLTAASCEWILRYSEATQLFFFPLLKGDLIDTNSIFC